MLLSKHEIVDCAEPYNYTKKVDLETVKCFKVTSSAIEEVEILTDVTNFNPFTVETCYSLQDYQEDFEEGDEAFFIRREDPYGNMGWEQVVPVTLEYYLRNGFQEVEEEEDL